MRIHGTSALISGGASGLGAGATRRLAEAGAQVTILDKNAPAAQELACQVGGSAFVGDVTDPDICKAAVSLAQSVAPLRVVLNCAGRAWGERTVSRDGNTHSLDSFESVQRINVLGTFNVMTAAAAAMAKTVPIASGERGVIINTASVAAYEGQIGQVAYSASKGAIIAMTLPAARDLAAFGIRVLAIAPGAFDTPLLASLPDRTRTSLASQALFPRRAGWPTEFGDLVVHLTTNSYLNATVIRLDGGIRMTAH